jgi:hypothetical protein
VKLLILSLCKKKFTKFKYLIIYFGNIIVEKFRKKGCRRKDGKDNRRSALVWHSLQPEKGKNE